MAVSKSSFVHDDGLLATVVATFATDSVVDVPGAAVGAKSQSRSYSLVVSSALGCAGLRLFAFRMCHFVGSYVVLLLLFGIRFIRREVAQGIPTRVGGGHIAATQTAFHFVD